MILKVSVLLQVCLQVQASQYSVDQEIAFDIPQQTADQSLIEFASQARITLVFPFDEASAVTTNRLKGRFTLTQGLTRLLAGTSLITSISDGQLNVVSNRNRGKGDMNKSFFVRLLSAILMGGTVFEGATAEETSADTVMEEVIVTARKRDESLRDVPAAITAFSQEQIARYNMNTIDELSQFTPGLIVSETAVSSGGAIALRGIGSGTENYLADQAVSINVDGMQVGSFNVRKTAQIDLAQVEVLRGPQALFFGKNSPGGVISLKTADPTDQREVELIASYENESGDAYYQAMYSGPISDTVGIRLVGRYSDLDGYFNLRTVPSNGNPLIVSPHVSKWPSGEEYFLRATLVAEPNDRLAVKAKISYNDSEIEGGSITPSQRFECPFGVPQIQPPFPCKLDKNIYLGGAPIEYVTAIPNAVTTDGLGKRNNDQTLATLELNYQLTDKLALTSLTGYYDFGEENAHNPSLGPMATALIPRQTFELEQWTQEIRLTSNYSSSVNFILGAFFENKDTSGFQDGVLALLGFPFVFGDEVTEEEQQAFSVFAQLTWDVTDRLELSGGLRYTDEEKDLAFFRTGTEYTANLANDSVSFDNLSPELSASYDINDEVMAYISYREGFKSGGFDAGYTQGGVLIPGFENTYDEEEVDGFEGGIRALFENRLALNLTLYSYEYSDLQVSSFDPTNLTFKVLNAAEATVQGVELDFNWMTPIDGLTFSGSYAYNDAEYDDFTAPCWAGQSINAGCNLTFDPNTGAFLDQDLSGRQLHVAPENVFTLNAQYFKTLSNGISLDFSINVFKSDEYIGNLRQAPLDHLDGYTKVNAAIRVIGPDDRWEVSLMGRNLSDKIIATGTDSTAFTGFMTGTEFAIPGDRAAFPTRGREVFLTLTYRPSS